MEPGLSHTFHLPSTASAQVLGKAVCGRKYSVMGAETESRVNAVMVKPHLTSSVTQKEGTVVTL